MGQATVVVTGVKKAGTTSLFEYLGQHPDICPSDVKATNHFTPVRLGQAAPADDYARHWSNLRGEAYRLEASSTYFYGGRRVATAISETVGEVRAIVSLREPTARMWSEYLMKRRAGNPEVKHLDFSRYVDACEAAYRDGTAETAKGLAAFARGCYADYVGDWLDVFGDSFKVVWFERWCRDPQHAMQELSRWMGIDDEAPASFDYSVRNAVVRYRSPVLARASIGVFRAGRRVLDRDPRVKQLLRSAHGRLNADPRRESMPVEARERLDHLYAEPNHRLATILTTSGHADDLPDWLVRPPAHD